MPVMTMCDKIFEDFIKILINSYKIKGKFIQILRMYVIEHRFFFQSVFCRGIIIKTEVDLVKMKIFTTLNYVNGIGLSLF